MRCKVIGRNRGDCCILIKNREAKMEVPVEETRQYIRDFDRLAGMTETARELYDKMLELYPEPVNPLPLLAFGAHG
jgi:hypothetical protein